MLLAHIKSSNIIPNSINYHKEHFPAFYMNNLPATINNAHLRSNRQNAMYNLNILII